MIFSHRRAEASWDLQAGRGKQMPNATLGRGKLGLTGRQGQADGECNARQRQAGAYRQAGASRWRMQRSAGASWDLQAGRGKLGLTIRQMVNMPQKWL